MSYKDRKDVMPLAEKDISEKTLEAYNNVFADIVNVLLFDGEPVVDEDQLTDASPVSQYKADDKLQIQKRFQDRCRVFHTNAPNRRIRA